jgi:hypothetical protein
MSNVKYLLSKVFDLVTKITASAQEKREKFKTSERTDAWDECLRDGHYHYFKKTTPDFDLNSQPSIFDAPEPEIGDLALIPVRVSLQGSTNPRGYKRIEVDLGYRFILVEQASGKPIEDVILPIDFSLSCVENLDNYLMLSDHQYEDGLRYTQILGKTNMYPDLYLLNEILGHKPPAPPNNIFIDHLAPIRIFSILWKRQDILALLPGVSHMIPRPMWQSRTLARMREEQGGPRINHFSDTLSGTVEVPTVGVAGTIIDKRTVRHSIGKNNTVVAGNDCTSTFYQMMVSGRKPMWFRGPVWKCPDELILPIYLPVI